MSHAARGLILELASHHEGFAVSVADMASNAGCSRARTQRNMNEALASKYLARKEYRTIRGHAFYEYFVRTDRPFTTDELRSIDIIVDLPDKTVESPSEAPDSKSDAITYEAAETHAEEQSEPVTAPVYPDGCVVCGQRKLTDSVKIGDAWYCFHHGYDKSQEEKALPRPVIHATADEYLPNACSECKWFGYACGAVVTTEFATAGV